MMPTLQRIESKTSPALMLKQLQSFAPAYYGAILRQLHVEKLSNDLLLESYDEIGQKISDFDPKYSTLFAWGFRIVRKHTNRKKAEMVLHEIFGCKDPVAYKKHRAALKTV